jgi:alkylation response protein AidB-like acyl-CoA dehydrogenase
VNFALTSEQAEFRDALRAWLESRRAEGRIPALTAPSLDAYVAEGRRWQRALYEGGWCGVHWPREYGGRGVGLIEQTVFQEELARADSPQLVNLLALSMVGPLIIQYGNEEQKRRYLRPILTAEEIWCQGYSEPGAGSDLAAVVTRAERRGDAYVVTGRKIWTSYAQFADLCILLARTGERGARHRGLTLMILPMRQTGVQIRPLRQLNGDSEFNELHLEEAIVPRENVIGVEGAGWDMAVALLMHERATLTFQRQLQSRVALSELIRFAREFRERGSSSSSDPIVRQRVAQAYIDSEAMRLTALRHLTKQLRGGHPGPEGSMEKLFWSEMYQRLLQVALDVAGPYAQLAPGDSRAPMAGRWPQLYLYSRGRTIAAGTSEIQRGIIAQRVLGLPKDR